MMGKIDIDQMEDLRDDMEEMKYEAEEVNEMLNMDFGCDLDEDELDDELAEYEDDLFIEEVQENQQKES